MSFDRERWGDATKVRQCSHVAK